MASKTNRNKKSTTNTSRDNKKKARIANPFVDEELIALLDYRIEQEEQSARLYHAMSLWLNDNGFMGAAQQWDEDSKGEMAHAQWAKEYLLDMGIKPRVPALVEPPQFYEGLDDIIYQSYEHELEVTEQCNKLAKYAATSGNYLLYQLTMKYMQEQQEELGKLQTLMDKLEAFGTDKVALRLLDNELAAGAGAGAGAKA